MTLNSVCLVHDEGDPEQATSIPPLDIYSVIFLEESIPAALGSRVSPSHRTMMARSMSLLIPGIVISLLL